MARTRQQAYIPGGVGCLIDIQTFAGSDVFQAWCGVPSFYSEDRPNTPCLFYEGSHWYAQITKRRVLDGVGEDHMAPGSQGLCQTLALIYYLAYARIPVDYYNPDLVDAARVALAQFRRVPDDEDTGINLEYARNARAALRFLRAVIAITGMTGTDFPADLIGPAPSLARVIHCLEFLAGPAVTDFALANLINHT